MVESGASALTPGSDAFDETIVVTQTAGEPPEIFAQRVMARVAGFDPARRHLESLTLMIGDRHDPASRAARRGIVLGLAAHVGRDAGSCELVLEASSKVGPERRAELLELVEEVLAASNGRPCPVRLVFGAELPRETPHRSGIFPAITQASKVRSARRHAQASLSTAGGASARSVRR